MNEPVFATVSPESLSTRPPFSDLLPINRTMQDSIETSMKDNGYDVSKPVIVWMFENVVLPTLD